MTIWLWYGLLGSGVGLLAGLLGVGGGTVIVPTLMILFAALHFAPGTIQHMALGTSLATILFTSISSFWAHHQRKSVDWPTVRKISPGIVIGTLAGAWVAARISTLLLQWIFVVFLFYVIRQMLSQRPPHPSRPLPGPTGMTAVGGLIGGLSSLVGIGGGSLMLPFLVWCNMTMRQAIGTSAAVGFFIAAAGTAGYMVSGTGVPMRPALSIGYVHLPAVAGIAVTSMLTAPLGAWLSHKLPVPTLKKSFAVLLMFVNIKLLSALLGTVCGTLR
jgi:uncharacterized membrane protein YfcA